MRDPGKTKFANYLCDTWGKDSLVTEDTLQDPLMIYDSGMLLQQLGHLWIKEKAFGDIALADGYVSHFIRRTSYTLEILVIFDDYRGITTKGHKQRQRSPFRSPDYVVTREAKLDIPGNVFLSNPGNKQSFLDILADAISSTPRVSATKCPGDADRTIITTAVDALQFHQPVIVRSD